MTIPESDSLWLRHLSGERLPPWEEERLLRYLQEDADLQESFRRDHEMDGLLRALDRARRSEARFLRDVRSLITAEKDRTRFVSRFRERMKRAATTRRVARSAAPPAAPSPAPRVALIAAEFLVAAFLLWAALSISPGNEKPAPQVRRPVVEEPAETREAPALQWAPARSPEPAPVERPATPELRPAPTAPRVAPVEPVPPAAGRHDTMPALAVLDRVDGDVYLRTPTGLTPAKAGHDLLPGQGLVTVGPRSRASVKYPDSTRFQIRGDTIVQELAEGPGKRVVLARGSFSIRVAKQPADAAMEITTPLARITVLGTRFSVACNPQATRVMVDEGRVRLTSLTRGETVEAGAGDGAGATARRIWSERPVRTYALPPEWQGSKADSAQGNPFRVDGRPAWRVDQIWPDDPTRVENYTPLVWSGSFWRASERNSGGQPSAEVTESGLGLGVRMWWPDQLGSKLASLAFIAPADGVYSVEGLVRTEIAEGGTAQPIALQVLTMDRKEKRIVEVASIPLASPELLELRDLAVPLKAQQELIFLPRFPERGRVAANVLLEGLKIHQQTKP